MFTGIVAGGVTAYNEAEEVTAADDPNPLASCIAAQTIPVRMDTSVEYTLLLQNCPSFSKVAPSLSVEGVSGEIPGKCDSTSGQSNNIAIYTCSYSCFNSSTKMADLECIKTLERQFDFLVKKESATFFGSTVCELTTTDSSPQGNHTFPAIFSAAGCWSRVRYRIGKDSLTFFFTENKKNGRPDGCDDLLTESGFNLSIITLAPSLGDKGEFSVTFNRGGRIEPNIFVLSAALLEIGVTEFSIYLEQVRFATTPIFSLSVIPAGTSPDTRPQASIDARHPSTEQALNSLNEIRQDPPPDPLPGAYYLCYEVEPSGLSAGAIAGIVIAVIIVLALIIFLLLWFLVFRRQCGSGGSDGKGSTGTRGNRGSGNEKYYRRTRSNVGDSQSQNKTSSAGATMYSATGGPAVGYERVPTRYTYVDSSPAYRQARSPALGSSTPGMKTSDLNV